MNLLNKSITIKSVTISNRIVMPPMATSKAANGDVTDQLIDYYDEKSKGGYIGLIITEHHYVSKDGMASEGQVSISRDEDVAGLKKIADVIHKNGSKVIAQINHAGSSASQEITGCEPISASPIINVGLSAKTQLIPREMDRDDILRVVKSFADAAKRVKEAGYDGVQIHSAHGYLLNQFYSPLGNKRLDEYGGTIDGRIKIHLEIIRAIREVVGDDFLLSLRLGASDYMEGGSTMEDGVYASKKFQEAGIDLLDISGGYNGFIRKDTNEPGWFSDATSAIKKEISIPLILTGGVTDVKDAEHLLKEGKADFIGIGRAIFKDSKWAEKAMK
ncbi:MAG: NADH:flavin oxidoreductase [Clostridiales bacterium]|nr:NADH:flavin oxidoreductase [Clostridiales bacterium]